MRRVLTLVRQLNMNAIGEEDFLTITRRIG